MSLAEVLLALAPTIARLIESVLGTYDEEAELQAMLQLQRTLANLRAKKMLDEAAALRRG